LSDSLASIQSFILRIVVVVIVVVVIVVIIICE